MSIGRFCLLSFPSIATHIVLVSGGAGLEQLDLVLRLLALFQLGELRLDLLGLDRSEVLASGDEALHIVATARVDMLQDLHGAVSQLLVLLREVVLDHSEHVPQVDLIGSRARLESLVDDQAGEAGDLLLSAAHTLDQLRVQEGGLAALKHREQDFEADVSKIRFVGRGLLQKVVMHGEGH